MPLRRLVPLVLALLPLSAVAEKPAAPPRAAPKPAAELADLKYFLGSWKCAGKQNTTPLGPGAPITGSAQGRAEVDGFWYGFSYEEKRGKEQLKLVGFWGYDVGGKRFVRSAVSNQGVLDAGSSTGWQKIPPLQQQTMLWTGEISGPDGRRPFRHTFVKKSEKEWTHTFELHLEGAWMAVTEVTCKK